MAIPIATLVIVFLVQFLMLYAHLLPVDVKTLKVKDILFIVLIQAVTFIGISLLVVKTTKLPIYGLGEELRFLDILYGFIGWFFVNWASALFLHFTGSQPNQLSEFSPDLIRKNLTMFIFTVAVLGPFYEEFIFRGVLLGMLTIGEKSKVKLVLAAVFTSTLFMLAHFEDLRDNVYLCVPLFLLGLYFSFWAIHKKGITLTIMLHVMQNFLATLALLYRSGGL